jgi:prepilin-type N-terminal cleavage/methylation domain-containing protein
MFRKKQNGFTAIEIAIVIAIIGILAAIAIPNFLKWKNKEPSADKIQAKQTETALAEANRQIGMPNIKSFQQRKLMRMIYELCDQENLICYAYIKSDYQGKLFFIGKCIGFGIPFSAQYTNPMKIADHAHSYGYAILPQADPNGLFMPTSSSATWLMMIDPKTNKPRPVYIEPEIVVSPFPLHEINKKEK